MISERDRLRGARASVTSRLGPLPAAAGVVIGLFGTVAGKIDQGYMIATIALFACLIALSIAYSSLPPYRLLLARRLNIDDRSPQRFLGSAVSEEELSRWLDARIRLEEEIYGQLRSRQRFKVTLWPRDLQEAFDVERSIANLVHFMFGAIIIVLLVGVTFD